MNSPLRSMSPRFFRGSLTALLLISLAGATGCKKPPTTFNAVEGTATIEVKLQAKDKADSTELKDREGVLRLKYERAGGTVLDQLSTDVSFTGSAKVPLLAKPVLKKKDPSEIPTFVLAGISILPVEALGSETPVKSFADFAGTALSELKLKAERGEVKILLTFVGADTQPAVEVVKTDRPVYDRDPATHYISIKSVFGSLNAVLEATDIQATLAQLRAIASATYEYHRELLEVARQGKKVDLEHTILLLDAAYFTVADAEGMKARIAALYKRLEKTSDSQLRRDLQAEVNRVERNYSLAREFGQFTNQIVATVVKKLSDFTLENATILSERLFAGDGTNALFDEVHGKFSPFSADQKTFWMDRAVLKGAFASAGKFALDYFKQDTSKDFESLKALVLKLKGTDGADVLIVGALPEFSELSFEQAKFLVSQSNQKAVEIALDVLKKVTAITAAQLVSVADLFHSSSSARDQILLAGLPKIKALNVNETKAIVSASYQKGVEIALACFKKVSSLKGEDVASVCELFNSSSSARDSILIGAIPSLAVVTPAGIHAMVGASYQRGTEIAGMLFPKTTSLTGEEVAKIAELYNSSSSARDTIILTALPHLKPVTFSGVKAMVQQSYQKGVELFKTALPKLGSIKAAQALEVVSLYNTSSSARDQILTASLDFIGIVPVSEIVQLMQASYQSHETLGKTLMGRLEVLTSKELASIVSIYHSSSTVRDRLLLAGLPKIVQLSAAETILLIREAYQEHLKIALFALDRIPGMTANDVFLIADVYHSSSTVRDTIVTEGLARLKSVKTAELIKLVHAAYQKHLEITLAGLEKTSDLSVNNAIQIVSIYHSSSSARDKILLKAIDFVTDLDEENLIRLADQAYADRKGVLKKGLERLRNQR